MMTKEFLVLGGVVGVILLFFIITATQIGKYVYEDAKERGYNSNAPNNGSQNLH